MSYLSALLLALLPPALSPSAQLTTALIAQRSGLLDLIRDFDVPTVARAALSDRDVTRAASAACLLASPDDLRAISARAQSDRAFAVRLGVHDVIPDPPDTAALLRILDEVQPHIVVQDNDTDGYAHAHTLWLSWFRLHTRAPKQDVDARARIEHRIDLALQLAPAHAATLQNARVLATEIGDDERAARSLLVKRRATPPLRSLRTKGV